MEKLLQWAVNNTDQDDLQRKAEAVRRGELKVDPKRYDPAIIEAILGKDDATRMKEAVACIDDKEDTVENKEIALDNLELLIEGIDNAMNIENMKLWPSIIAQFSAKEPSLRKGSIWVAGTAVQNNPAAQKAFLKNNGLEPLVAILKKKDEDKQVRSKAIYAISCFLKHFKEGVEGFEALDGFSALANILKDEQDASILRKVVFSFNSLMLENPQLPSILLSHGVVEVLDGVLAKYTEEGDEDMVEKVRVG
ncbi:armadillo-type protein [Phycomyces nitens]|nr:armadillo-type protein [Phycomyces nitens]